jgi:putative sulfotransferase
MRDHHRALFDWLTKRFGREHWIERSGSSFDYLGSLAREFPDARFVHIHRDGREVALSVREHHAFRVPVMLMCDMPTEAGRVSEIGPLDLHAPPTGDDLLSRVIASRPPAHYFGRHWSDQLLLGFRALRLLDARQYLEVSFEDLVTEPLPVLEGIADFFELGEERDWIDRAAKLVRGAPKQRFQLLAPDEQEALADACRPGFTLLGRT